LGYVVAFDTSLSEQSLLKADNLSVLEVVSTHMINDPFIQHLAERLQAPLPGPEAQFRMAHVARRHAATPPPNARQAGVLALFYPKALDWHIVLIEREQNNPNDRHGGQISFPGGKHETGDATLMHTALREAEEEVGAPAEQVQVLGALTPLYIPVSNFQVNPFVGFLSDMPTFRLQTEEVRSILEVDFHTLRAPHTRQSTTIRIASNMALSNVPYFNVQGKVVWGATAMILNELLELSA
jgi:8-oxo-dGTP pyrophosphatase MutT (NUDIX family)